VVNERPSYCAPLSPGLLFAACEVDPFTGKVLPDLYKERTSSCKTSATYISNASGSGSPSSGGRNMSQEDYGTLSESRRSISRSKSSNSDGGKVRTCFKCMCPIS
jgi:hypothetical protein